MPASADAILIVDDDPDILRAGELLLKRHYAVIDTCEDPAQIAERMAQRNYHAILLDMNFGPGASSGEEGISWLQRILEIDSDAVVVLITAHGSVDLAVEAVKMGATDFITKPWHNEKLLATLSASVKLSNSRREARQLRQTNSALLASSQETSAMLGQSPAMQAVHNMIERAAPTEANVLILGEHGTGKELAAHALHQQSARKDAVFISVDLGSLTESLFESELFGHVKGAFTSAISNKTGLLQAAKGGTLFLDEIGNLPLHLQAKLLTVLEQRRVSPVGSTQVEEIDVRLISATNLSKEKLTDENHFRQDLLFRLNTVEIELPPLRDRQDDILLLANHFIDLYNKKYARQVQPLSKETAATLLAYSWPGNVRALRHAMERAVILCEGESLSPIDFQLDSRGDAQLKSQGAAVPQSSDLNLDNLEKKTIQEALGKHGYNISHAAKELGLTRAALYRRMEKHGL